MSEPEFGPLETTPKRHDLIHRSGKLDGAANRKLAMRHNEEKGDDWDNMTLFELMLKLAEELEEFRFAAFAVETMGSDPASAFAADMFRVALLNEGGDLLNLIRFICSKYEAI